jgi:hypothetical protein
MYLQVSYLLCAKACCIVVPLLLLLLLPVEPLLPALRSMDGSDSKAHSDSAERSGTAHTDWVQLHSACEVTTSCNQC